MDMLLSVLVVMYSDTIILLFLQADNCRDDTLPCFLGRSYTTTIHLKKQRQRQNIALLDMNKNHGSCVEFHHLHGNFDYRGEESHGCK